MIEDLYQEIILDHYRTPRNRGALEPADIVENDDNPVCGDEITIYARIDDNSRIEELKFDGHGCSISMASASMMTDRLRGMDLPAASRYIEEFRQMMRGVEGAKPEEDMGDMEAMLGVRKFPVRIKCATIAWSTLAKGIARRLAG